ncbi:MAG TPA: hypothetical protein VGE07_22895 [Herpetosiphonaceae bacterium]
MTLDIQGWVEILRRPPRPDQAPFWIPHIKLHYVMPYHDLLVAVLFGWPSTRHWTPVAELRGLPPAPSWEVEQSEGAWGHTWIGWDEIQAIPDRLPIPGLVQPAPDAAAAPTDQPTAAESIPPWRDQIGVWSDLFAMMDILGQRYGPDRVRLVVWFDN